MIVKVVSLPLVTLGTHGKAGRETVSLSYVAGDQLIGLENVRWRAHVLVSQLNLQSAISR